MESFGLMDRWSGLGGVPGVPKSDPKHPLSTAVITTYFNHRWTEKTLVPAWDPLKD